MSAITNNIMEATAQVEKSGNEDTARPSELTTEIEKTTADLTDIFLSETYTGTGRYTGTYTGTYTGLTRKSINDLSHSVQLIDSDENLDLFCYSSCKRDSPELVKQCRGVVFNHETLVMKAFPYTLEFNEDEKEEIKTKLEDWNKWSFYEAREGTLLRMFYFGEKWYISTHRKLNAFESKWSSSKSFGRLFVDALNHLFETDSEFKNRLVSNQEETNQEETNQEETNEEETNQETKQENSQPNVFDLFKKTLDINKQYMFLVSNSSENRIVCNSGENQTAFHVGTFVDGNFVSSEELTVGLPLPLKLAFESIEELFDFVRKIDCYSLQGVIGFTNDNEQVKILNKEYQTLFELRGNEPSVKFRYLQLRNNKEKASALLKLYPQVVDSVKQYETIIYDIATFIYNAYIQRFIKKLYVTVPKEEFSVIRECHSIYISDRSQNISLTRVINVLDNQPAVNLNHMIKRFKLEQSRRSK